MSDDLFTFATVIAVPLGIALLVLLVRAIYTGIVLLAVHASDFLGVAGIGIYIALWVLLLPLMLFVAITTGAIANIGMFIEDHRRPISAQQPRPEPSHRAS